MSSTARDDPAVAVRQVPALLYPTLLIAGIAVIAGSLLGIAAMTGLLPQAQSQSRSVDGQPAAVAGASAVPAAAAPGAAVNAVPAKAAGSGAAAAPCAGCGVVETVRVIEAPGAASGLGAVAGGVVGGILGNQVGGGSGRTAMTVVGAGAGAYAGHELERNMKKETSYEIRVRMDDRSYRTLRTAQPGFGAGQRVKVREGRLVRAD